VKGLQRNRTCVCVCVCVCVCISVCKQIYYKESAAWKDKKSQALRWASWKHRWVNSMSPGLRPADSKPRKSQCSSSSPKASRKQYPSSKKSRQIGRVPLTHRRVSLFVLFSPSNGWWGLPTLERTIIIYFTHCFKCSSHPETHLQTYPE
jgi:hypothetical protein